MSTVTYKYRTLFIKVKIPMVTDNKSASYEAR